jgi:hypothetical protein
MKRFLFPALAALMLSASSAAFAQGSGPWYVVYHDSSRTCDAEHQVGVGGRQQTVGGPYASQDAAISALDRMGECGGSPSYGGQ